MTDDETSDELPLFAGEELPPWRCPKCETTHAEKLEGGDECKARIEFRRYARASFAKLDWGVEPAAGGG